MDVNIGVVMPLLHDLLRKDLVLGLARLRIDSIHGYHAAYLHRR